jgi:hypothetical protein
MNPRRDSGGITWDNPMKSDGSFGTFMKVLPLDRRTESATEQEQDSMTAARRIDRNRL